MNVINNFTWELKRIEMKLFNLFIPLSTAVNTECHHGQGFADTHTHTLSICDAILPDEPW